MDYNRPNSAKLFTIILALAWFFLIPTISFATTINVYGDCNIFGAGHSTPPDIGYGHPGILPPSYGFQAGPNQVLTFSIVTGSITYNNGGNYYGPEDWYGIGNLTDIISYNGISGIYHSERRFFLTGVFLTDTEPSDPAPSILSFGLNWIQDDFRGLYPEINQTFFIGDGLTGTGEGDSQMFHVPENATRLFLGFADGYDFEGLACLYSDNSGALITSFDITPAPVPEPASMFLLGAGIVGLAGFRKKFKG